MKKLAIISILLLITTLFAGAFNDTVSAHGNSNNQSTPTPTPTTAPAKVTICHATGSAKNPYNTIHTDMNGINGHFNNNGTPKAGHENDILLQGTVDCPTPTATPTPTDVPCTPTVTITPTATPTPTIDECENNSCEEATPTPTETVTPTEAPTVTPNPTIPPSDHGDGLSDGRSDGRSSCPSCTQAPQGQVLGASTSVLGASTMASTGSFTATLMNIYAIFGMLLVAAGFKSYAKEKKAI